MSEMIERLATRGDGVTASGRFVAGAVPGDSIADDGTVTAGPHRQTPPCRHFGKCGGCQLQHVDDDTYATFLTDRIVSALIGQGISPPEIRSPHLSPPGTRRRVAFRALRLGKRVTLGFAESASHRLVDLVQCPIMEPRLFEMLGPVRQLLVRLLKDRRPADIRMTLADQGVDLMISGVEAEGLAAAEALMAFAQKHRLARLSLDEGFGPQIRWEPEQVTVTLADVPVGLPEGSFLQATRDGEDVLVASVVEAVGASGEVTDLFAGLGTFAFAVPGRVHAVEGARDAILALQAAANRAKRHITTEHRDLFRRPLTAADLNRFDAVILDPPRAGAKEQVVELAKSVVPHIAFVSCNPATFGRDAKALIDGGYQLDWVQPIGQFRWSTHVELVAYFHR